MPSATASRRLGSAIVAEDFQAAAAPYAPPPDEEVRVYQGGRVFAGTDAPVTDATIVVRGDRIAAVVAGDGQW